MIDRLAESMPPNAAQSGMPEGMSSAVYADAIRTVLEWEDYGNDPLQLVADLFELYTSLQPS